LARVVGERLTALLEGNLRKKTGLEQERMQRFSSLAADLAGDEDSVKLLCLLLDEAYQASLHAPPPQPEISARTPASRPGEGQGRGEAEKRRRRRRGRSEKSGDRAGD
jgi:ATP-dependent RNA helicase DeaD